MARVFPKLETVKIFLRPLPQKCRCRKLFDSQHVEAFQIHAKSPWERFCHVFSSLSWKLIWKMPPLALGAVLVVFVNRLTVDGKYPVQDCEYFQLPIQMQLSEKRKTFSQFFFFHFWKLHQILKILKKMMILIVNGYPKLGTVIILLRPLSKKRRFRTRFDSQHVKVSQIRAKSQWERLRHVFPSLSGKLIWKMSPLVLDEVLVVFVNRLTADGRYPVRDCDTLLLRIQM